MIIFGGVDGTYEWSNDAYKRVFKNSFVKTLYNSWTYGPRNYERGPITIDVKPGDNTFFAGYRTFKFVLDHWKGGESAVFLAGYSRGAAAVIEVAKELKKKYIPVECLILFDPVDRTPWVGGPWNDTPIVDTVKNYIYAKRSPAAKSREITMGNCGLKLWDGSNTVFKEFMCTHGGMGGVPWKEPAGGGFIDEGFPDGPTQITVEQDRLGSNDVQRWSFDLIETALSECRDRLAKGRTPERHPGARPGQPGNAPKRTHTVKAGDWLSKIAITYYGDMNKWTKIYEYPENKEKIGNDPNIIKVGDVLVIP